MQKRRDVATTLREIRTKAGLTQDQLAHKIGYKVQRIPPIENGTANITLDRLLEVCDGLGVEIKFVEKADEYEDL